MALRPFLSRNMPNLFPSTAAMSSLLLSPPPQPQQPLPSTVRRRTYLSSIPTALEFTQGGPASLGSHALQPETIQSEPTTTWANLCPISNELLYTTTFTDQHQYSCDCPEFQLHQHTCRHVDQAKQSIIQMKLNAQQEELDAQQEELDVRRAELTHADTILLEAATNPATSSTLVVGIDEAGAGPVIGPMIFCAVVLSKDVEQHLKQQGVKDSKDVPPKKRGLLREVIMDECIEYNTIVVHAQDIDRRRKGGESMNDIKVQAVSDLLSNIQTNEVTTAYIDAFDNVATKHDDTFRFHLQKGGNQNTLIVSEHRADSTYTVVGAASLIAKTERDRLIAEMEQEHRIVVGSGYPSDPKTLRYLKTCKGVFPDFVRQSWKTVDRFQVNGSK